MVSGGWRARTETPKKSEICTRTISRIYLYYAVNKDRRLGACSRSLFARKQEIRQSLIPSHGAGVGGSPLASCWRFLT